MSNPFDAVFGTPDREDLENLGYDEAEISRVLGEHIPAGLEYPAPSNPMAVARCLLPSWQTGGRVMLRSWRGSWMRWRRTHWAEMEDGELRSWLYQRLEHAVFVHVPAKGEAGSKPWAPTKRKVSDILDAVAAIVYLSNDVDPPSWLSPPPSDVAGPIVACANGLLHVTTRKLIDLTPEYFNVVSVPFAYDPTAPQPAEWLAFLGQIWPNDPASVCALQEWFGYVISGRTDLHKMILIVGPPRGGKGTIGRILQALIGDGNTAGPSLATLATNFGLASLLGKSLAVIGDARNAGKEGQVVIERLLSISGEDTVDVDRKHKDAWSGRLHVRFMLMSNELPNFGDMSGAIATRFVILTMVNSWLGREDNTLEDRLRRELPGILNWALDGLDRLTRNGRFTEPESSREAMVVMLETASPMHAFVHERCERGPGYEVHGDDLWDAWKSWCEDNDRKSAGNKQMFGRNLRAAIPQISSSRPRGADGNRRAVYYGIRLATGDPRPPTSGGHFHEPAGQMSPGDVGGTSGDVGPCVRCSTPTRRYGEGSNPLCPGCRGGGSV